MKPDATEIFLGSLILIIVVVAALAVAGVRP